MYLLTTQQSSERDIDYEWIGKERERIVGCTV